MPTTNSTASDNLTGSQQKSIRALNSATLGLSGRGERAARSASVWTRAPGPVFYPSVSHRSKGGRYVEECLGFGCQRRLGGQRAWRIAIARGGRAPASARYARPSER